MPVRHEKNQVVYISSKNFDSGKNHMVYSHWQWDRDLDRDRSHWVLYPISWSRFRYCQCDYTITVHSYFPIPIQVKCLIPIILLYIPLKSIRIRSRIWIESVSVNTPLVSTGGKQRTIRPRHIVRHLWFFSRLFLLVCFLALLYGDHLLTNMVAGR